MREPPDTRPSGTVVLDPAINPGDIVLPIPPGCRIVDHDVAFTNASGTALPQDFNLRQLSRVAYTHANALANARIHIKKAFPGTSHDTLLGAIKYTFTKHRMGGDIVYDVNESVSLDGNSGPYLQYAHARARSILRKTETTGIGNRSAVTELLAGERSLVRKLTEYPEVVDKAVAELMPHYISTYLYELAQAFNRFYEGNRVIGDEREAIRVGLIEVYAKTLQAGLSILGIAAPEKM